MIIVGIITTYLMGTITDQGDIVALLMQDTIGRLIGLSTVFSMLASIYIMIFKVLRNNN